jgi:hypothetical protein
VAVIQEAYVKGVSTRKVDDLVRAMGASGVSKSEVSRLVVELHADLAAFRERRLDETAYPYRRWTRQRCQAAPSRVEPTAARTPRWALDTEIHGSATFE